MRGRGIINVKEIDGKSNRIIICIRKGNKIVGMFKTKKISELMASAGFDAWGVVRADELSDAKARFEEWLAEGNAPQLDYLHRNVEKRFAPALLKEGARSVVVGAVSYKNTFSEGYKADFDSRIASYALAPDYHVVLKEMLREVAVGLGIDDRRAMKICVDSTPLAEKTLARLAGIGWIGRNSLIVNPQLGSFMVLGALVLTEECDTYSTPYEVDGCVGCSRCLLRCPTGAINPNRSINTTLCISNRTVEQGSDGEDFDTHGWVFGCDECQTCCPHNTTAPLHVNPRFAPVVDPTAYDSTFWANITPEEGKTLFEGTPLVRRFKG